MYDENTKNIIINNLEQKAISIVNATVVLTAQGYVVNKAKKVRFDWSSILLNAFENIDIFNKEQQHNIELLYNKLSTI